MKSGVSSFRLSLRLLALLGTVFVLTLPGETIDIGFVSFDVLIPGIPGAPGVDVFNINNLTGDPLSGGFALPPEFPVISAVTFENSRLVLNSAGSPSMTIDLGNLQPGSYTPPSLEFPDTGMFSSAEFSAELVPQSLMLSGGDTFQPASPRFTAFLGPASGMTLQAGSDSVLLSVSTVPEPSLAGLAGICLVFLMFSQRKQ